VRVFVTGGRGMLGRALGEALGGHDVCLAGRDACDVTDAARVDRVVRDSRPDVVVHAAAWTDVDGCERDAIRAWRVNTAGSLNVARAAASAGARLVAISTDYVFAGELGRPLREEDPPNPQSRYGVSKLEGERSVRENHPAPLILRSCGVYGPGGRHFPGAIAGRIRAGEPLRIVSDQVVSPTYSRDLAAAVAGLVIRPGAAGLYHVANDGHVSWYDFAREVARVMGREGHAIAPITSSELDRPAERPAFSALDSSKLRRDHGLSLRRWAEALAAFHDDERGKI
jgi:dTDP-4-dehydrorhamnose reductase